MNGQNLYPYQVIRCDKTDAAFLRRVDLPADPQQLETALAETVSHIRDTTDTPHSIVLVSVSEEEGVDLDYEVVYPALTTEGAAEACLSVLAGAGTFALETGLVKKVGEEAEICLKILNIDYKCDLLFSLKDGQPDYEDEAAAVAIQGPAAAVFCLFHNLSGAVCGGIIPSGHMQDEFDSIQATCVDNGVPVVCLRADDFGLNGQETAEQLNQNQKFCSQLESIRKKAGLVMGLADVTRKRVPYLCLVSSGPEDASLHVQSFFCSVWQSSIDHLTALSVATAAIYAKSVLHHLTSLPEGLAKQIRIVGEASQIDVLLELNAERPGIDILRAGFIQTTKPV